MDMDVIKGTIKVFLINKSFLSGAVMLSILTLSSYGIGVGYTEPVLSISTNNEPVKEIFSKISRATGYKIEITKGWDDKTLTANLKKVNLEDGLREIMRIMGGPNYSLIINESKKKVEIRIFDNNLAEQKKSSGAYVGTNNDFRRRSRVAAEGAMADVSRGVEKPEEPPEIEITPPEIEVVSPDIDAMRRPE
jgi:hypothetical protein